MQLPADRLWVSVFKDDEETYALWENIDGLPKGRIIRLGEKDNFWAMGDTGPCGPCSEILIDQGPTVGCGKPDCRAGCDCDRYLELWNLVFMQFNRDENGEMKPLPKPSIDTGMGLERIAAVVQGVHSNYDSDLFSGIIKTIAAITGKCYGDEARNDTAMRVIADHSRATVNLVADGVFPSNEGRGYVLRRILRRAIRYGRTLGMNGPFLAGVMSAVLQQMAGTYPHLLESEKLLLKTVRIEEERFFETIDNGLAMLSDEIKRLKKIGDNQVISGDFIFKLYDTYGFPVDIVKDIAVEERLTVDEAGFSKAMATQREQSRKSWKAASLEGLGQGAKDIASRLEKTRFCGYEARRCRSVISAMLDESGQAIDKAGTGARVMIVCPETPFYAESGGQIGDEGEIAGPAGTAKVINTIKLAGGVTLHEAEVIAGVLACQEEVELRVAEGRRQKIANNHTATHLLQAALRAILGDHVKQSGSLVESDRLRFDFIHFSPLTKEEIKKIEDWVNHEIRANLRLNTLELNRDQAQKSGAIALFGEKYDDLVRVVSVGDTSKELCGGTHVGATGEIGLFKLVSETGIAAGVRRIEAITGPDALNFFQRLEDQLVNLAELLKTSSGEAPDKITKLLERQKQLEKEVGRLTAQLSFRDLDRLVKEAREIDGIRVIAAQIPLDSPKTLREVGDRVRDKMGSGVAVLGGVFQEKVALLGIVSKDMTNKLHAGNIIKEISKIVGGSGGGRPDMAQAGGVMIDKLPEALSAVYEIVKGALKK